MLLLLEVLKYERMTMLRQIKYFIFAGLLFLPAMMFAGLFSNPYNHFYADAGAVGYYLQQPKFEVGTLGVNQTLTGNTTVPLVKMNVNHWVPQLHLAGGYWFMNCNDNWLTRIFGNEEAFEADLNYTYYQNIVRKKNLGLGNVWLINGSGSIFSPNTPKQLNNFKLSSRLNNIDTGVYFKGKLYTTNPKLVMIPKIGIVNTYYDNRYRYSLDYSQGDNFTKNTETFDVAVYYYGLALGDQLNYQINKHWMPFALLEVQLLNIHAILHATQDTGQNQVLTVNDSVSTFNYRAIAALGVRFQFYDTLKSPSLSLSGGVDHWNYVPSVVPPNRSGDKAVHLHGESMNNGFVMIDFNMPFG